MKGHDIKNSLILFIFLGFAFLIFVYLSFLGTIVWTYVPKYTEKLRFNPPATVKTYFYILEDRNKRVKQREYYEEYLAKNSEKFRRILAVVRKDPRYKQKYAEPLRAYSTARKQILALDSYIEKLNYRLFIPPAVGLLLFLLFLWFFRAPIRDFRPFKPKEKLHGDAKWAKKKDVKKAGLFKKHGVILGRFGSKYMIADGYQHSLLFAPTGSGKGVGFVIPNLLFWQESAIVHDIKLENYELTSGYRKKKLGQKVFLWNPASPEGFSHCYNPFDWVSRELGQMVDDVQKMGNLLLPEQEFWQNEARSLFLGVALYLLSVPEKTRSFGEVVRTLRSDDFNYNMAVVLDTLGDQIHPVAYMNLAAFLQKADKERSGVVSTLNSGLELWANPLIDTTTATSDFDFNRFKKEPHTVYVGLTPDNIERLQPLMQVFYQQAAQIMTAKMPTKEDKIGVLMMMDEFPTLGEMAVFKQGIAYFRGYKVRLFLIIQDTEQLKDIYEEAGMNSFIANASFRITFAANTIETAKMISELIGNKTVKQYSRNTPVFLDLNPASRSKHISEGQRALLLPQEVIGLPTDEQILLIESQPPIKSKKIYYYKDPFFKKRLHDPSFVPNQEPYDPKKRKREEEERKKAAEEAKKAEEEAKSGEESEDNIAEKDTSGESENA